jgi:hypothetical protein
VLYIFHDEHQEVEIWCLPALMLKTLHSFEPRYWM